MKKLLLILNPRAGQRKANRYLPDMLRLFWDNGYQCVTYVTKAAGDATQFLLECEGEFDLVVCIGGDGTLNETVAGILGSNRKCPIGYIPAGTTNDYASSIGLSGDVMQAARDIMCGQPHALDVGLFNGRYFVYTATTGAFAKASYTTSQAAKNLLGHAAYVLEGMRDLASLRPLKLHIETDGRSMDEDFIFCSITNSTSVGGILKLDSRLVSLNDGLFEVTLVKNPTNPAQLSRIVYGLTTLEIPNEMIYFFSANKISISCENDLDWTLDGEREASDGNVELENLQGAIQLILPVRKNASLPVIPEDEEAEIEEDIDEDQLSD